MFPLPHAGIVAATTIALRRSNCGDTGDSGRDLALHIIFGSFCFE
jgi:hypothetical protein